MAVPATAVFECNSGATAANANGAGFDPGNVSMATDLATTNGTAAAPVVTSASYNFVAGDAGKWLYVQAGTNWIPGWYPITSVGSNAATLNATIGSAILAADATKGYPPPKYVVSTAQGCCTQATPGGNGTWSVDYSQHTAAIQTAADLVIDAVLNTKVTSAARTFGACDVGNVLHITAGTGWTVGWYFIMSVAAGAATLDRSPGLVAITGGTYYEGGAASLNSATAGQTDTNFIAALVAGNFLFGKGTFTLAAGPTFANAAFVSPIRFIGYVTNRGTTPTGTSRPTINTATVGIGVGNYGHVLNWIITGSNAGGNVIGHSGSGATYISNCKVTNTTATADSNAISVGGADVVINCEATSYRGRGINAASGDQILYNYIHDSNVGVLAANRPVVIGNIIESCVTSAINATAANGTVCAIYGNTLYGAENKLGTGVALTASDRSTAALVNNILYGFVTAVSQGTTNQQNSAFSDFNNYFNSTTDNTNWYKGPNDQALDPAFASVSQITGTAGKFRAGNDAIIDTTKNFTTLGVVAGRDCIYIKTGTGITAGIYGVSSIATTTNPNDTLVLDLAPGTNTTADKAYQLTVGHNFAIGTALKAKGFPGAFQASLTTGYADIGAVQRSETGIPMRIMGVM